MSNNRGKRSQEEREVQNVLSPSSQSTISGDFETGQENIAENSRSPQATNSNTVDPNALQATNTASNAIQASISTESMEAIFHVLLKH